jgi:hypothetical protein
MWVTQMYNTLCMLVVSHHAVYLYLPALVDSSQQLICEWIRF